MANQQSDAEREGRLRRDLERRVTDLTDGEWDYLRERAWVAEALAGDLSPKDLADEVWRFPHRRERGRRSPPERGRSPLTPTATRRERAVARVIAADAERDFPVRLFRLVRLGRRLLRPEEIDSWVKANSAAPTRWVEVPVPRPGERLQIEEPPPGQGHRHLAYEAPAGEPHIAEGSDGWAMRFAATTAGGALEELREIADGLHGSYGWNRSAAATWVLSGVVPPVPEVAYMTETREPAAASRLVLVVDPTVRPDELAQHYRVIRRRLMDQPHRDMSDKHAALGEFAATRPPDERWQRSMERWNARDPQWTYSQVSNFTRDAIKALRRLRDPGHNLRTGVAGAVERPGPTG